MGKSTISMVIFNSCVTNYQRETEVAVVVLKKWGEQLNDGDEAAEAMKCHEFEWQETHKKVGTIWKHVAIFHI